MGYVYVTENPRMPGVVKIGHAKTSLEQRRAGLNHTGVLGKHEFVYWCEVDDCVLLEGKTHKALAAARDHGEFFRVSAPEARRAIRSTAAQQGAHMRREYSHPGLDRDDAEALRQRLAALEVEYEEQGALADTWNPFLRGRAVKANERQRQLSQRIALLRERLERLEDAGE